MFDFLIVGAGFSGCVLAERIATKMDKKVLLIDKSNHVGGHCYDYFDQNGILVHKFGPHIFHTKMEHVFSYLSQFTDWIPYFHTVLGVIEGKTVPIPFNLNSMGKLFPKLVSNNLTDLLVKNYGMNVKIPVLELKKSTNKELKVLADYVYEKVFEGYTYKQWGLKPEELSPSVTSRIPIYISKDDRYFQDKYQCLPKDGYTNLFNNLISHKNIKLLLNTDYNEISSLGIKFDKLIYTGPIDEFYDYQYGELPYRSLNFKFQFLDQKKFQDVAQINYPNNYAFTRITEFKHMTKQRCKGTTIVYEYPVAYNKSTNLPYYPVPTNLNKELFEKYNLKAKKSENILFLGRLADYKYYNMDQTVDRALNVFENILSLNR